MLISKFSIKERAVLVSERSLEHKIELLRACFEADDPTPRGAGKLASKLDGTEISLEVALPSIISKLLFASDFERSSDVNNNLRAVLNLLGCLLSDLDEFVRTTPRSAAMLDLFCPFKVELPELREEMSGHRAVILSDCPNFPGSVFEEVLLKIQNIYINVLGLTSWLRNELGNYLKYKLREESYFPTNSPFDEYGVNELRSSLRNLMRLLHWLKYGKTGRHPLQMGKECHLPCLVAYFVIRYHLSMLPVKLPKLSVRHLVDLYTFPQGTVFLEEEIEIDDNLVYCREALNTKRRIIAKNVVKTILAAESSLSAGLGVLPCCGPIQPVLGEACAISNNGFLPCQACGLIPTSIAHQPVSCSFCVCCGFGFGGFDRHDKMVEYLGTPSDRAEELVPQGNSSESENNLRNEFPSGTSNLELLMALEENEQNDSAE